MKTPIYADLDQIVFEDRSREYGAYQMRKRYNRILGRASLIAFIMFIGATAMPKMISWVLPENVDALIAEAEPEIIVYEVPLEPLEKKEKEIEEPIVIPPTQRAAPEELVRTVAYLNPVATPDDDVIDDVMIANNSDLDSAAVGLTNSDGDAVAGYNWSDVGDGDFDGPDEVTEPQPKENDDPNKFVLLEKEPVPVNMDELTGLIGYPQIAKEGGLEGKVVLRVKIDKLGNYEKHVVLKSPHTILLKAVTDHIDHLVCTPGIQSGKAIPVWVTIPFNFVLNR